MADLIVIDQPGVYDLPIDAYHADPVPGGSLSSTGARKLLPPSCPALFKHWRDNPEPPKKVWDIGHAAHKLVLGVGPELVLVDRDRWDTKDCKAEVAAIREAGNVPLKRPDYDRVHAMAAKLHEHPIASALFAPGAGLAEQTLVWRDARTGVMCRALLDWLPLLIAGRRLILPDYKSGRSAAPDDLDRTLASFGYHIQLAWYLMGLRALGYADEYAQALLVVQETEAPYLVTVAQPDPTAMRIGAIQCRDALNLYAECVASGRWPGYSDEVELIALPVWVERQFVGETV